jgi:hypothetical protein
MFVPRGLGVKAGLANMLDNLGNLAQGSHCKYLQWFHQELVRVASINAPGSDINSPWLIKSSWSILVEMNPHPTHTEPNTLSYRYIPFVFVLP